MLHIYYTLTFQNELMAHLTPVGVKLTLSALIDGKNVNSGGHKVGLGFEVEA